MPSFQGYEIVQELSRGPLGAVVRAVAPGGGDVAVKIFDPMMMGLLEADAATQSFLDRAALQKLLAERGASHWAPVRALGGTTDGAYYVADYYPLTVESLAAARVPVDAKVLHALASGVVNGLLELRMRHRRAHANLKATNVLVAGSAENLVGAKALLTDPATEGDTAEDREKDLFALGDLIHHLVLHRPFTATPIWPVPASPEWARLGRTGERWRELCNWLLAPNSADRRDGLEAVVVALRDLAPAARRRVPKRLVLAALAVPVVLLGLVVAGGAMLSRLHSTARAELATQNGQWLGAFEKSLADPARRQAYRADPDLKAVLDEIEGAEAEGASFDPSGNPPLSLTGYRRTRAALARAERIRQQLAPDHWRRLAEIDALRRRYEARRWEQPAAYLAGLVKNTQPAPGVDVAAGIDRLLRVAPGATAGAAEIEGAWAKLDADAQLLDATGDKVLAAFAAYFRAEAAAAVRLTDEGAGGVEILRAQLPTAGRVVRVVQSGWPDGYSRDLIAQRVESSINTLQPTDADIRAWVDKVPDYALSALDDEAPAVATLRAKLAKMAADAARQEYAAGQQAEFAATRQSLEMEIARFRDARYPRRDIALGQGEVVARGSAIQREIDGLRKRWVKDDPQDWVESVDPVLVATSEQIKNRWKEWVRRLGARKDALAADPTAFKSTRKATEDLKNALADLSDDKKTLPLPPGLSQTFTNAAWERREQELAALTADLLPADPAALPALPPVERVEAAKARFSEWTGKLVELAKDFPLRAEILSPADRPDSKWAKDAAFWKDVQPLVAADVRRLADLRATEDVARPEVARLAAAADAPEIALAAWQRLGRAGGVTPAWPSLKGELDAERASRAHLAKLAEGVKDTRARAAVLAELKAQGPERWRRFAATADPEALAAAYRLRGDFDVDAAELMKLAPPARFNLAVYGVRAAVAAGTEAAIAPAVTDLQTAAAGLRDQPDVAELLRKLDHLKDPEPMAAVMGGQRAAEVFKRPIPNSQSAVEFVRVTPAGMRPFYLARAEVSVGTFIDLVNAAGNWSDAHALLGTFPADGRPPVVQRGPQGWAKPAAATLPLETFDTWRYDGGRKFELAELLRKEPRRFNRYSLAPGYGDNPSYDHPMQQVPAQAALYAAALAGCRLPTAREWQAAQGVEAARPAEAALPPNLRDETWLLQQAFGNTIPGQWPGPGGAMTGVYAPPPATAARPPAPPARDNTLFFRPVMAGGGTFVNLVGNVAEFTCDAPESFEPLAADPRRLAGAEVVAALARTWAGRLRVVGGSALSPPEVELTRPYPVDAPDRPYADVGFRLAFTAPAASTAERVQWVLAEQPYLPVSAVTK